MKHFKTRREPDFERLGRFKVFSWLTPVEVKVLTTSLAMMNYKRGEVISRESTRANDAHVLVAGIARITCLNANNERVTVRSDRSRCDSRAAAAANQPLLFPLRSLQQLQSRHFGLERL